MSNFLCPKRKCPMTKMSKLLYFHNVMSMTKMSKTKMSKMFRRYRRKKGNDEVGIVRPSEEISPPSKIKLVRKFVRLTFFVGLTF